MSPLWVMEKYINALSWWLLEVPAACCWAGMQGTAVDFLGRRPLSSSAPLLPGVTVTVATVAWEVAAATERIREADRGSSLILPPFFSCRNSRNHVRNLRRIERQLEGRGA